MAADLGGKVGVETEPLEMDTQNFRKTNDTHLFEAIRKAERERQREGEREREREVGGRREFKVVRTLSGY